MDSTGVIALLTDFGTHDSYVAQMKGVIVSRCNARVIDLSHDIPPFDAFAAGIFLREAAPQFEPVVARPIVIVTVVDPGVGSSRRILAAEYQERIFVAPDNGVLSVVLDDDASIVEVTSTVYDLPSVSNTFHGRDRFAPLAAAIVQGALVADLGSPLRKNEIVDLGYRPPDYDGEVKGSVVRIDRFGNIVTDLDASRLGRFSSLLVRQFDVKDRAINYEERTGTGDPFVIVGSMGTLEISIARDNAAEKLGISVRDEVRVVR